MKSQTLTYGCRISPLGGAILRQGYVMAMPMFYTYILRSSKSHLFYYGHTSDLKRRLRQHNDGIMKSTKPHIPWRLVWYGAFETLKQAKDFELYLKTGSGKAFAYKRLVNVALKKDFSEGRKSDLKF